MELAVETELVDYSIKPFDLTSFPISKSSTIKETINIYYAKCAFRIKTLRNMMLTPLAELGLPNIDRIKGFSIDMFLTMQKQRMLLSNCVNTAYDLNIVIKKIEYITKENNCSSQNFERSKNILNTLKPFLYQSMSTFEQLIVLLNIAPTDVEEANNVLYKNDDTKNEIKAKCVSILEQINNAKTLHDKTDIDFPHYSDVENLLLIKRSILNDINSMIAEYSTLPLFSTIKKLINYRECMEPNNLELGDYIGCIDDDLDTIVHQILLSIQTLYKHYNSNVNKNIREDDDAENLNDKNLLSVKMSSDLMDDWSTLKVNEIVIKLKTVFQMISSAKGIQFECINTFSRILPILKQYYLLLIYLIQQQLASHHVTVKTLNIMLGVFITMSTKGFCIPPDLVEDQDKNEENSIKGEGFGLEDGSGEKDASDKIESEDQLENAKKPDDIEKEEQNNCKEEKGIEMSEHFEAEQQDVDKPEDQEDDSGESDIDSELDKEMGETEKDADKLDNQIWGDDEEKDDDAEEDLKKDDGEGSSEKDDMQNGLENKNKSEDENVDKNDRLAAAEPKTSPNKEKSQKDGSDQMEDQTNNEEQSNQMHNDLDEPPEPEEMELGDIDMNNDDDNQQDNVDENNPFDIGKKIILRNYKFSTLFEGVNFPNHILIFPRSQI